MENQPLKQRLKQKMHYLKKLKKHFLIRLAIGTFLFYYNILFSFNYNTYSILWRTEKKLRGIHFIKLILLSV